jgi:TatD DNase family protein
MTAYLIDSHCHLTSDDLYGGIDGVIARAAAAGVRQMVTIATDAADARRALALSARFANVHVACGVHPHEADRSTAGWDSQLWDLVRRPEVLAVGETGLDYHYDFSERAAQQRVFRRQLEIAADVHKPVIIHCREAHVDTLAALRDAHVEADVVFHCFTGSEGEAREILDAGYWISLTGVVTFKKSEGLRAVARLIPPERLMMETDCPYLSPEPLRNVRPNEPARLVHTARCIAEARGLTIDQLAELTTGNARRFFSMPDAGAA